MSNEAKTTNGASEKHGEVLPVATEPMYETGEVSKVAVDADPALQFVSGMIEYTEEEGRSVLSKIVSP